MRRLMLIIIIAGLVLSSSISAKQEYIKVKVKRKPKDLIWKTYDTRTMDLLEGFTAGEKKVELDKYGGKVGEKKFEATGFFYPKKLKDRWWLVDPEGNLFVHVAIVAVYRGLSDIGRQASAEHFGSDANWAEFSAELLHKYSFNGTGGWTEAGLLRKTRNPPVYTLSWDFMADFAASLKLAHQVSGHMGYPDEVWPIFHPKFEAFCDEYAKQVAATKDDPYCIGHFSDNELQTPADMLDRSLRLDLKKYPEMRYNFEAAKKWLSARKGKEAGLRDIKESDRSAFLGYVMDTYYRLTTTAIRKYDSNHLCIGSRLYGRSLRYPEVFKAAGKYLDVVSVNYYRAWTPDPKRLAMWAGESGKPVMITEWYAKGADSGLPNNTGAGWLVPTQKDRGRFYQNFALSLMETKVCVGWHWFKYRDNNPEDLTTEPSNRDSNKGVVNYKYEPYVELLDEMKRLNDKVYTLIDYFDAK